MLHKCMKLRMWLLQNTEVTEGVGQTEKVVTPEIQCEEAKPSIKQLVNLCIVYCQQLNTSISLFSLPHRYLFIFYIYEHKLLHSEYCVICILTFAFIAFIVSHANGSCGGEGRVFTGVCLSVLFFHMISQNPIQLESPNLT